MQTAVCRKALAAAGWAAVSACWTGATECAAQEILPPRDLSVEEAIVVTEAAGEPFRGKVGVAEVIRNRGWNRQGFSGLKRRDLRSFLSRQPRWVYEEARKALRSARAGSNLTRRATHFENVKAFGKPPWADEMEQTARIGRLTFYRPRRA